MVREGDEPSDLVVVIRAAPATVAETVDDMMTAAAFSAETYVVERDDGSENCSTASPFTLVGPNRREMS